MAYAAANAGVVQLTRDLGVQLARTGVRVNALADGALWDLGECVGCEHIARDSPSRAVIACDRLAPFEGNLREESAALEPLHPIRVMIADRSWLKLEVPNRSV